MRTVRIKISCPKKPESKLLFVKKLKEYTGLGLKDAKDIADSLFDDSNYSHRLTFNCESVNKVREDFKNCGGETIIFGGEEYLRELKLLNIGLGEHSDYVNFILENLDGQSINVIKSVIKDMKKEQLMKITNKFEI